MKRAIFSVYDKKNIVFLAKELKKMNWEIIATQGTGKVLKKAKIDFVPIEKINKIGEIFGGKLKTISPQIEGGLLLDRENEKEKKEAEKLKIFPIDMVVCNFYPLPKIDIGGPCMVRAGAKNYKFVTVVVDPKDYQMIIKLLKEKNEIPLQIRLKLAKKAFLKTSQYDRKIFNFLTKNEKKRTS